MNCVTQEIKSLSRQFLLDVYPRSVMDLVLVKGEGMYVWDSDGKKYLDFAGGNGLNIMGYKHPALLEAAHAQIDLLVHAGNYFYNEPQAFLAQKLAQLSGLDKVFFSNSGAEAVEAAIKLARRWGSRQSDKKSDLICFDRAWHGRTLATISATGESYMQAGFGPLLPGFSIVPHFDLGAIEAAFSSRTVGVLCEPILGHGGITLPPADFFPKLRKLCDQKNALLLLDEVQTSLGRTGSFFNFEQHGIKPDIVCLGKGLGGGFPIGATLCSNAVAECMEVGAHGSAAGGNPLCTRVAGEVVSITSSPVFLDRTRDLAKYFIAGLNKLQAKQPAIQAIRGSGLLIALDLSFDSLAVLKAFSHAGLLATRVNQRCIRFLPPLIVSREEIDLAIEKISSALDSLHEN